MNDSLDLPPQAQPAAAAPPAVPEHKAATFLELFLTFFYIGSVTFGGLWASTKTLQDALIRKKNWITEDELQMLMVAGTLIPSPKFLAFAGMVGYKVRGWWGSVTTVIAILTPGAAMVLIGAMILNPRTVGAALVPVSEAVQCGVVGLLLGNAYLQLKGAKARGRNRILGPLLAVAVAVATIMGVSLIISALAGITLGALILQRDGQDKDAGAKK